MKTKTVRIQGIVTDGRPQGKYWPSIVEPTGVKLGPVEMRHRRAFESERVCGTGTLALVEYEGKPAVEATIDIVLLDIEVADFLHRTKQGKHAFGACYHPTKAEQRDGGGFHVHECRVSYVDLQVASEQHPAFRVVEPGT